MLKKILILTLSLFMMQIASAQLAPFNLTVNKTNETCTGNGSLTFVATETTAGSVVIFKTYKLPDTGTPIASQSSDMLTGLVSGTYLVIATQTLNGESNSDQQEVVIDKLITPLVYNVTGTNSSCENLGTITVNVTSGTADMYEIISGPVIRPLQASNIFTDIPAGSYEIRVFDTCGEALVKTYIVFSNSPSVEISSATFDDARPDCNSIKIKNNISVSEGGTINYPLTFTYTVFPPNGGPAVINTQTITSGTSVSVVIPFYNGAPYTYTVSTTGSCGETVSFTEEIRDGMAVRLTAEPAICGLFYLKVFTSKFTAPYTMQFLSVPEGFDPATFNPDYPNFSEGTVKFGSALIPVPGGTYKVKITDACGNIAIDEVDLVAPIVKPVVSVLSEPGCISNYADVKIRVPGRVIVSAVMITAPAGFALPLPADMMSFYNPTTKTLEMLHLISGDYVIKIIDECGIEHIVPFKAPSISTSTVKSSTRPDCDGTTGTIKVKGNGVVLTEAQITQAPAEFTSPLPYDAAANIDTSGQLVLNAMPPGTYLIVVIDECGKSHNLNVNVEGQIVTEDTLEITRFCGAFKFQYTHVTNTNFSSTFWLQRYNPITGTWGHPQTDVEYIEGSEPTAINSLTITNGTTVFNVTTFGDFRILKKYVSFGPLNGAETTDCFVVTHLFNMDESFAIKDIVRISCDGSSSDIQIITDGVPPLTFKIIEKNGLPFLLDNGESSIFLNLEPAIYKFQVQQSCGNIVTQIVDVANLPEPFYITQPTDIVVCDDADMDNQFSFDLSQQNAAILNGQNPAELILTYHTSLASAQAGTNPLPLLYLSGTKTIYVRLQGLDGDCYKTTSFQIAVKPYPKLTMKLKYALCEGNPVTITADAGMTSYLWSTGETTPSITVSTPGTYTLAVEKNYGGIITCPATYTIDVQNSITPVISNILISDWTYNENSITVVLQGGNPLHYLYSLDNINFQESNIFQNLKEGSYEVFVKNIYGCGNAKKVVHLLNYPRFFTPNGDGTNDTWHIKFAKAEPKLKVYIFDRYGKLIKELGAKDYGWDGTLNGKRLPSTDYWFLVTRQDGQELRGHFSMKR